MNWTSTIDIGLALFTENWVSLRRRVDSLVEKHVGKTVSCHTTILAQTAAKLARLAYDVGDTDSHPLIGIREKDWHEIPPMHPSSYGTRPAAIIVRKENNLYIAFRGTSSAFDWIWNLLSIPCSDNNLPIGYSSLSDWFIMNLRFNGILKDFFWERKYENIILTGHSLGGAVATICAKQLMEAGRKNVSLYTFGAPRASGPFTKWDPISGEDFIIPGDIVPTSPPFFSQYRSHRPVSIIESRSLTVAANDLKEQIAFGVPLSLDWMRSEDIESGESDSKVKIDLLMFSTFIHRIGEKEILKKYVELYQGRPLRLPNEKLIQRHSMDTYVKMIAPA